MMTQHRVFTHDDTVACVHLVFTTCDYHVVIAIRLPPSLAA